ncbi:hypothetical protein GCM10023079_21350 [Streptomyces chitinivorans]
MPVLMDQLPLLSHSATFSHTSAEAAFALPAATIGAAIPAPPAAATREIREN